jgi:hypothetical protein
VVRTDSLLAINTLSEDGTPQFIHSATYEQLLEHFGLSAGQIAASLLKKLQRPA